LLKSRLSQPNQENLCASATTLQPSAVCSCQ
jgi:hypothetical protein